LASRKAWYAERSACSIVIHPSLARGTEDILTQLRQCQKSVDFADKPQFEKAPDRHLVLVATARSSLVNVRKRPALQGR
jgi:hypothetical protein